MILPFFIFRPGEGEMGHLCDSSVSVLEVEIETSMSDQ